MEERIYVRRDKAHNFRNIAEVFPTVYNRAVEEIKKNTCRGNVNYPLLVLEVKGEKLGLEFKGENYSICGCNVDIGIIDKQDESKLGLKKQKRKSCINVIVITASDKERLSELERKIGLDGTFVS